MDKNDYKKYFVNFPLTLENYDNIMDYMETNDKLNEENIEAFNLYESIMFEFAINEIIMLRNVLKNQHDKYVELLAKTKFTDNIVQQLKEEISRLAEKEKQEKDEIHKQDKKRSSFIEDLKNKFSKFFD